MYLYKCIISLYNCQECLSKFQVFLSFEISTASFSVTKIQTLLPLFLLRPLPFQLRALTSLSNFVKIKLVDAGLSLCICSKTLLVLFECMQARFLTGEQQKKKIVKVVSLDVHLSLAYCLKVLCHLRQHPSIHKVPDGSCVIIKTLWASLQNYTCARTFQQACTRLTKLTCSPLGVK